MKNTPKGVLRGCFLLLSNESELQYNNLRENQEPDLFLIKQWLKDTQKAIERYEKDKETREGAFLTE